MISGTHQDIVRVLQKEVVAIVGGWFRSCRHEVCGFRRHRGDLGCFRLHLQGILGRPDARAETVGLKEPLHSHLESLSMEVRGGAVGIPRSLLGGVHGCIFSAKR